MLATPAVLLSAVATILAIVICIFTTMLVARARGRYGITAPAMSGHPMFERALRVQMNTVEQFVVFLPALWLATLYFHMLGYAPGLLGFLWCAGRLIYAGSYMADPGKRHVGFGLTILATILLLVLAIIGVAQAWAVT